MKQIQLLLIPIFIIILIDYKSRDAVSYGEIERLRNEVKYLSREITELLRVLKENQMWSDTIIERDALLEQFNDEWWYINTGMDYHGVKIYEHSDEVKSMLKEWR